MAWLARLDAAVSRTPVVIRWPYAVVKWTLVAMGAVGLVGHYVMTWGWPMTIYLLGAPAVYGFSQGLSAYLAHRRL
jgi:hypothetical protein